MRSANIADLRNHLTQYLREVRAGQEIVIRDRNRPIAKIVPLPPTADEEEASLIAQGILRKGTGKLPPSFWRRQSGTITERQAADAVSRDRDDD